MRITVKYMAQLRQAAGVAGEAIDIAAPCTADDLLRQLAERRGDAFRRIVLTDEGRVQSALLLFVGDEQIRSGMLHDFHDDDVVTILAPMAGG
jgi:molybdopterin converting factor small subunit